MTRRKLIPTSFLSGYGAFCGDENFEAVKAYRIQCCHLYLESRPLEVLVMHNAILSAWHPVKTVFSFDSETMKFVFTTPYRTNLREPADYGVNG